MEKHEIFKQLSEVLSGNEQLALECMVNGDNVVETADNLACSVADAQKFRQAVYAAVSKYVDFGTDKKVKQQKLINFINEIREASAPFQIQELEQQKTKLEKDLAAAEKKLKPFEDSYFGKLTFEEIAELAKKSIRVTADNSELEDKIEKLSEELDNEKEICKRLDDFINNFAKIIGIEPETAHPDDLIKRVEDLQQNEKRMLAEQSAEYVRSFKNQLLHALDIASSADEIDLDSLVEKVEELRKQKDSNLFNDFEVQNSAASNFLVFNPKNGAPNKVYKNINSALEDAKSVAKKEQEPVFVLRIDSLVVPQCTFDVHDVSQGGIPERYLSDGIPF